MTALLAALLLAAPADDNSLHVGISLGAGVSYQLLGPQVSLRWTNFAVSAAAGVSNLAFDDYVSNGAYAFGARYLWESSISGPFLQANWMWSAWRDSAFGCCDQRRVNVGSFDLGWRFKWPHLFIDLGIGPALYFDNHNGYGPRPVPDVIAGIGFEI